jgi:hypothetical protein
LLQRTGLNDFAYNDVDDVHINIVNIPKRKRVYGRPKHRSQDNNIKEYLTKEIWYNRF